MKQSILVSAPSRASFGIAACLLVPQVVQSERTYHMDRTNALAPGIDRLVDTVNSVSRRSLQGDSIADLLGADDDLTLNILSGIDEDLLQCMVESFELLEGEALDLNVGPNIDSFMDEDNIDLDFDVDFANNKGSVSMVFKEGFAESLGEFCNIAGGFFAVSEENLHCTMTDPESGMDMDVFISGFSFCVADTPSCRGGPNPMLEMVKITYLSQGAACDSTKPETLPEPEPETLPEPEPETLPEPEPETLPEPEPETLPETEPEALPEPEPETLPEPEPATSTEPEDDAEPEATDNGTSAAMDSGAGAGSRDRLTGYLTLTGILVVASAINFA